MAKDLLNQINDCIAPVTKAWVEAEIMTVTVAPDAQAAGRDDELVVDVRLTLKKTKKAGR